MVQKRHRIPHPDPEGRLKKTVRRPKATLAAWVAVAIAAVEVVARIFGR